MQEFFTLCFSWPALPATVLVLLICVYWIFVTLGAMDIDGLDVDFDTDGHADSLLSMGLVPLRLLNIGEVPLMLWISVYALCWWITSMLLYDEPTSGDWGRTMQALFVSGGIALLATKGLTQPLRGRFIQIEPHTSEQLIGKMCVITSSTATTEFGEARFETGAAPLQLRVRPVEGSLTKGTVAEIVDYDAQRGIHLVREVEHEV